MAEIHVHIPGGVPIVYPEHRIAELMASGELSPDTLYWQHGMDKWQPLNTYQPSSTLRTFIPERRTGELPDFSDAPYASPPVSMESPDAWKIKGETTETRRHTRRFHFRRRPQPLTAIVQVLMAICICITILQLANALVHYNLIETNIPAEPDLNLSAAATPAAPEVPEIMDDTGWTALWISIGVNLLLLVPYGIWLYRTNLNCRNFSFILRFKPAAAVTYNFVPILNAFMPCLVMQEIWRVSRNPRTWHNDRPSLLVGIWWTFAVATAVLGLAAGLLAWQAQTRADVVIINEILLFLFVAQLFFYGTWLAVITIVIQNQVRLVESSRRKPASATQPPSAS